MQSPLQAATAATDPKSVKVNLTSGTGVDIEWNDGHVSHYAFVYLRDACPCAMCEDERGKAGRRPGDPPWNGSRYGCPRKASGGEPGDGASNRCCYPRTTWA